MAVSSSAKISSVEKKVIISLSQARARSILVAPKSEVLYALAAQVVRMQHAA
jgi:hypothetical protein